MWGFFCQDDYAISSYKRSAAAYAAGAIQPELFDVEVPQKKKDPIVLKEDEEYKKVGALHSATVSLIQFHNKQSCNYK